MEVLSKQIMEGLLGLLPQGTTSPFSSPVIPSFTGIKSLGEGSLQGTSGAEPGVTRLGTAFETPVLYMALGYISVTILNFKKMSGRKGDLQI